MIRIEKISKEVFDEFFINYKYHHFLHNSDFSLRRENNGWKIDFLGYFEDENLIGAMALVGHAIFLGRNRYELTMGPMLDYDDLVQTNACLMALTKYCINIKALNCEVSPNLAINIHYPESRELTNKAELIKVFEDNGWIYNYKSDEDDAKLRWFFKKDLTKYESYEDLIESYDGETKRLIRVAKSFPLKIIELSQDNIERATNLFEITAKRRAFETRDISYHKSLNGIMNKKDEAKHLVVELDVNEYLRIIKNESEELKKAIKADESNTSKRAQNRVNQNKDQLKTRLNRIDQLNAIDEKKIDISAGVFIGSGNTMTYLFGGSKQEYMRYYGAYFLQDYTLKYALENGYETYDFYGTLSTLSGHPEQEGVFNFKKGFGGDLVENLGFFDLKPKSLVNSIYEGLRKVKQLISK